MVYIYFYKWVTPKNKQRKKGKKKQKKKKKEKKEDIEFRVLSF